MYSCGHPHMANQKQDDQLEHTYSSYVMIRDVTLKTCQRWWMIGRRGERGSGIYVLVARHDDDDIYIYIYIYIFIIISCRQHGYPWPSLTTPPYRSSLLVGPQGYIPYPQRAAVCRFELVALLLLGHVRGPIEEHHIWARPYFSSSVLHVWFI